MKSFSSSGFSGRVLAQWADIKIIGKSLENCFSFEALAQFQVVFVLDIFHTAVTPASALQRLEAQSDK